MRPFFGQAERWVRLAPSPPRLGIALRAGLCMFAVIAAGAAAGRTTDGLLATLGVFTALYLSDRPYFNRGVLLAGIAAALALSVMGGLATQGHPAASVALVAVLAALATILCTALRIGPPGSYMLVLACAAGTALPQAHLHVARTGALVALGGGLAWAVQMSGALVAPRGPERAALARAAQAVAMFADHPAEIKSRHAAAQALNAAWAALVGWQPGWLPPGQSLLRLRLANLQLHQLFAACVAGKAGGPETAARALALPAPAPDAGTLPLPPPGTAGLGDPGLVAALRDIHQLWSPAARTAGRTGLAAAIAGLLGALSGLQHSYWAMAAAVLVLNQGMDFNRSLQRGLDRILGTLLGLCLLWLLALWHPAGLALALLMAGLQFTTEMLVTRNYALAVMFITAIALSVASDGYAAPHLGALLLARAEATLLGCLVAFAVHALWRPGDAVRPLRAALQASLRGTLPVLAALAAGAVTTPDARRARQILQHRLFQLAAAYEMEAGGLAAARAAAARLAPTLEAAEQFGYRVLAACWALDAAPGPAAEIIGAAAALSAGLAGKQELTPAFLHGLITRAGL